jgi:hypothetical protein
VDGTRLLVGLLVSISCAAITWRFNASDYPGARLLGRPGDGLGRPGRGLGGPGDEDRGLTEQWLAAGVSRTRLLRARSKAFALVALVACLATVLGIVLAASLAHQDANVAGELGKGLSLAAGVITAYAIALLVAQVPAERQTATALGVGVLVVLLVVNGLADTVKSMSGLGVITPFHWLEKTTSGAPGGTFDVGATLLLAVAAVALIALAVPAFARRDVGSGLVGAGGRAGWCARPRATCSCVRPSPRDCGSSAWVSPSGSWGPSSWPRSWSPSRSRSPTLS